MFWRQLQASVGGGNAVESRSGHLFSCCPRWLTDDLFWAWTSVLFGKIQPFSECSSIVCVNSALCVWWVSTQQIYINPLIYWTFLLIGYVLEKNETLTWISRMCNPTGKKRLDNCVHEIFKMVKTVQSGWDEILRIRPCFWVEFCGKIDQWNCWNQKMTYTV